MEKIIATCTCGTCISIFQFSLNKHLAKRGFYLCRKCIHTEIWKDPNLKEKLSTNIKSSEKYQNGILNRPDNSGKNNPMFGRKLSNESKAKMSASRMGKTGKNATAWKGGKDSIYRNVKVSVFRKFLWGSKVNKRDNNTCLKCSSTTNLDAHHIIPFKRIFNECSNYLPDGLSREETITWYLSQALIRDDELTNGITLCRSCHRYEHNNWGSHEPKTK